ncbi:MAG: hypothetical protein KKD01_04140 [Proteobacteria bacterium]|nr:hypothetical protein [Pseudomonadota bacterium]MBU1419611.1 hypothetical protein [Pseudomonadota bacterium]MBU1453896.1 hypothetical protein [Pseudomonadota bacterium]
MTSYKWKQCYIQALMITYLLFILTGCAGNKVQTKPYSPDKISHYSQLTSYDEATNLNNHVFYINAGETIPLKLSMETDFMDFKQDQVEIIAKQKLYFLIEMPEKLSTNELTKLNSLTAGSFSQMSSEQKAAFLKNYMLSISKDAIHWAPLFGSKAYREVLDFKEGLFSFAILVNTADGLNASLDIRTVK